VSVEDAPGTAPEAGLEGAEGGGLPPEANADIAVSESIASTTKV
jgi:hypothetical protein